MFIMNVEMLEKIKKLTSECIKAQRDAERWNNKCMDLPPRIWIRWWRNTSIQAKASIYAEYRDKKMKEIKTVMLEFID